jgi:hypothetical protein
MLSLSAAARRVRKPSELLSVKIFCEIRSLSSIWIFFFLCGDPRFEAIVVSQAPKSLPFLTEGRRRILKKELYPRGAARVCARFELETATD